MEKNLYIKRKGALFEHSQAESITRDIRVVHLWWPSPCQGADGCEWTAAARSGCHMSCMTSLPPHCSASACCCWIAQSRQAHCSTSMLLSLVLAQFTPCITARDASLDFVRQVQVSYGGLGFTCACCSLRRTASCESPAVSAPAVSAGHAHKAKAVRALLHGLLPRHTAGLCMCFLPVPPLGGPLMLSVIYAWT